MGLQPIFLVTPLFSINARSHGSILSECDCVFSRASTKAERDLSSLSGVCM